MGFLQNDTTVVFLDAVLTDTGRQALASNDGSFSIVKFAVSDDEVDYTLIKKLGRTFGIEAIEKNTPVLEAITNQLHSQKFRLVSISDPTLTRMPYLTLEGEGVDSTGTIVSIGATNQRRKTLSVYQTMTEGTSIDVELRDQLFSITMDNRFLQLANIPRPDNITTDQKATYIVPKDASETSLGGSKVSLVIATKTILESQFQLFGSRSNQNIINTYVKVTGFNSGQTITFQIQINKTS